MDTDDICREDRFEKQLRYLLENESVTVVGSCTAEFIENIEDIVSYRIVPETSEEIVQFSKRRSPFNHPTIMFRKSHIVEVGGYRTFKKSQDFDLFIRLLTKGYKGYNFQSLPPSAPGT